MVLLKDSLLEIFKFLDPLKKLTKNVGLCWNSSHTGIFDYKFNIIYQGKDKSDASKIRYSVSLHGVWLRAVFATFGFSKKINSLTPQSVSLRRAWLRTVLVNFGFKKYLKIFRKIYIWTLDSRKWRCSKANTNCLTPCCVSLRRVRLHAVLANFGFPPI